MFEPPSQHVAKFRPSPRPLPSSLLAVSLLVQDWFVLQIENDVGTVCPVLVPSLVAVYVRGYSPGISSLWVLHCLQCSSTFSSRAGFQYMCFSSSACTIAIVAIRRSCSVNCAVKLNAKDLTHHSETISTGRTDVRHCTCSETSRNRARCSAVGSCWRLSKLAPTFLRAVTNITI